MNNFITKTILFTSLTSFWSSVIYYVYALNNLGFFISLILTIATFNYIEKRTPKHSSLNISNYLTPKRTDRKKTILSFYLLIFVNITLISYLFYELLINKTTNSIISPWQLISTPFFIAYFLVIFLTFLLITINNKTHYLLFIIYFLSFSLNSFLYQVGYGFDPFIHEAALKKILNSGLIEPKSPYYIGEYSLAIFLYKLTPLSLSVINKFLVPALAAIFIPSSLFVALKSLKYPNKYLIIILFLILPFSYFTFTTPQSLGYLFIILLIIYSLLIHSTKNNNYLYLTSALSLACLVTHPMAGIPAVLFSLILFIQDSHYKHKLIFNKFAYLILLFIIPTIFILTSTNTTSFFNFSNVSNSFINFIQTIHIPQKESIILNFAYLYNNFIQVITLLLAALGFYINKKNKYPIPSIYLKFSLLLFFSYILTNSLNFNYLIQYERYNYANRLLLISHFFLIPYLLTCFNEIIKKILQKNTLTKIIFTFIASILILSSLYISHPRYDNYFNSRGYSTGNLDIQAVEWIHQDAGNQNYIVLANQQVSAASLHQFGFNKYYKINNEEIFYYPIPTGGKLYQYYLSMVYDKPTKQTISNAMLLTNTNISYFVLNKYWWGFNKLAEEAKLEANSWITLGNKDIYIFKFLRK